MLNTLANHGYIPRSGLNFTLFQLQDGFTKSINLAPDSVVGPWNTGMLASTTGFNNTLNLHDLVKHNLIEHDASLSRLVCPLSKDPLICAETTFHNEPVKSDPNFSQDTYFGNANDFNDAVWAQVNASYGLYVVTAEQVAASRLARVAVCAAENPEFNLTTAGSASGWTEAALFLLVMGNKTTGDAPREFVEVLFRKSPQASEPVSLVQFLP